jgi:plastocyanin
LARLPLKYRKKGGTLEMTNGLKSLSLLAMVSLLGLLITGCNLGGAADYGDTGGGSGSQAGAPAAASPNSNMSNIKMPEKRTSEASKENTPNSALNEVIIQNFSFAPATLTVKAGTKVTWVNRDDEPHTAADTDKRFKSSTLDTGDKFSFTFNEPGTYNYYCTLHPKMTGQIIVK